METMAAKSGIMTSPGIEAGSSEEPPEVNAGMGGKRREVEKALSRQPEDGHVDAVVVVDSVLPRQPGPVLPLQGQPSSEKGRKRASYRFSMTTNLGEQGNPQQQEDPSRSKTFFPSFPGIANGKSTPRVSPQFWRIP